MQETQYIGYRGQGLHWMRIVETGQQGTGMAAIGGHNDAYAADESPDKVYGSNRIMKYVLEMVDRFANSEWHLCRRGLL